MSTIKVLYDHAKQTEPVKLGQLKELITEVRQFIRTRLNHGLADGLGCE